MNIEKYIELLRFYVTEKIDEINLSNQKSINDMVENIISSIVSSVLALLISTECIQEQGIAWTFLEVLILIVFFIIFFFAIKWFIKITKTEKQMKTINDEKITRSQAKKIITDFDHIACDSILLAWDFLKKFKSPKTSGDEEMFCLIEAIYYFKKALLITKNIVSFGDSCVNNINLSDGIAPYRIKNASASLDDIYKKIQTALIDLGFQKEDAIFIDVNSNENDLKLIVNYAQNL